MQLLQQYPRQHRPNDRAQMIRRPMEAERTSSSRCRHTGRQERIPRRAPYAFSGAIDEA